MTGFFLDLLFSFDTWIGWPATPNTTSKGLPGLSYLDKIISISAI
jgi:hypothetical protein